MTLFSWAKKGRQEVGAVAGFGKVPALGDFVRTPPRSEEMNAFEDWITAAMEHGEQKRGAAWKDAFARADPVAFLWGGVPSNKTRGLLAGVVRPSHDSVRRCFPIVICAPLPVAPVASSPHLTPIMLVDFFRRAARAASVAADAKSQAEFQTAVSSAAPPAFSERDVGLAKDSYARFAQATRVHDLPGKSVDFTHAVHTIIDATEPLKGREAPQSLLGARAHLSANPESSAALYIDLVRTAAAWNATVPTFFWPLGGSTALIQLGIDAPPSVLLDLWLPQADSDHVCELSLRAGSSATFAAPLPEKMKSALADDTLTIDAAVAIIAGL